jgi:hypothetical protein
VSSHGEVVAKGVKLKAPCLYAGLPLDLAELSPSGTTRMLKLLDRKTARQLTSLEEREELKLALVTACSELAVDCEKHNAKAIFIGAK